MDFETKYRMHGRLNMVIVLAWWKVCRYFDGPTNVTICSHGAISKVYMEPEIPEVEEINMV